MVNQGDGCEQPPAVAGAGPLRVAADTGRPPRAGGRCSRVPCGLRAVSVCTEDAPWAFWGRASERLLPGCADSSRAWDALTLMGLVAGEPSSQAVGRVSGDRGISLLPFPIML